MKRLTIELSIFYDGRIDNDELKKRIEAALDSYIGYNYNTVQYVDHLLVIEGEVRAGKYGIVPERIRE